MIGSHDARLGDRRTRYAVAAERIFEDRLLLQDPCLGDRQGLLSRRQLGLGADDGNWRQRPDFHLLLVIAQQLLVEIHGLLLDLHVFAEANEIPIQIDYIRDDIDHLLLENQIGQLAVILGDLDVPRVHRNAEAL